MSKSENDVAHSLKKKTYKIVKNVVKNDVYTPLLFWSLIFLHF